jgi:hypothetical protein
MKLSHLMIVAGAVLNLGIANVASADWFQGFETDNSGFDVFPTRTATRVPSGTNGITSATGSFHGLAAGPNNGQTDDGSAFTRYGGYNTPTFGSGWTTKLDIYLKFGAVNDTRFDWSNSTSNLGNTFRRDFVFNGGYYNDSDFTGSGNRFVFNASNNATRSGAFPKNGTPFSITTEGWYTFENHFYDLGGVETDDMSILDAGGNVLHTWTLSNPADLTATAGGHRYGWVVFNEFDSLAIDNATLIEGSSVPEPASLSLLGLGVGALMMRRRVRKA